MLKHCYEWGWRITFQVRCHIPSTQLYWFSTRFLYIISNICLTAYAKPPQICSIFAMASLFVNGNVQCILFPSLQSTVAEIDSVMTESYPAKFSSISSASSSFITGSSHSSDESTTARSAHGSPLLTQDAKSHTVPSRNVPLSSYTGTVNLRFIQYLLFAISGITGAIYTLTMVAVAYFWRRVSRPVGCWRADNQTTYVTLLLTAGTSPSLQKSDEEEKDILWLTNAK
jgi:hypothetical protein